MFTEANLASMEKRLTGIVEEGDHNGIYRARRDMFTDAELFELEMKHIFEGNWVFMAHESQIPNPGDYFTVHLGRVPVVITRDKAGELHALVNSCTHRGAMLCRFKRNNTKTFTCPFHGWTFSNDGRLLKVKNPKDAGYPEDFNKDGSHDLRRVKLGNYRGFLCGSLNHDVPEIEEYLGETTKLIDLIVDQSDEGVEVLRGSSTYTFDGNWKLQAENGADGYHVSSLHWNYVQTTSRRGQEGKEDKIKANDASKWDQQRGGFYAFDHGHILLWNIWADASNRPAYMRWDEYVEKHGETRARWMVQSLRNLCIYPNVFLMDQFSSQIRMFRPIDVDKTEVTIYCIAPILALMDALALDAPILAGCSMGGRIALQLAALHPNRFSGFIAIEASDFQPAWYDIDWFHRPDAHGGEMGAARVSANITIEEQVDSTRAAFEAGATIAHCHVRDDDGQATCDPERFAPLTGC